MMHPPPGSNQQHLPHAIVRHTGNEPDRNYTRRSAPAKRAFAAGALQLRHTSSRKTAKNFLTPTGIEIPKTKPDKKCPPERQHQTASPPAGRRQAAPGGPTLRHQRAATPRHNTSHGQKQRLSSPVCETRSPPTPKQVRHLNCGICLFGIILLNSCRKSFY